MGGEEGDHEPSGVANEPSGVGGVEGAARPTEWQKTQGGDRQGVQGGVKLPQGIDTPGVAEFPWGDETPGVATELEVVPGEDRRGWVGDGTPPHHPRNQGVRDQRQRQGEDRRAGDSGAAMTTAGHGSGWIQRGDPAQAYCRHRWRQAQK